MQSADLSLKKPITVKQRVLEFVKNSSLSLSLIMCVMCIICAYSGLKSVQRDQQIEERLQFLENELSILKRIQQRPLHVIRSQLKREIIDQLEPQLKPHFDGHQNRRFVRDVNTPECICPPGMISVSK